MKRELEARLASGVRGLSPYQPGKPIETLQRELGLKDVVKLASNENSLGTSPDVAAAIQVAAQDIHRYPDGNAYLLKEALVSYYGAQHAGDHNKILFDQITLGNGSNDVLELVARAFLQAGDHAVYSEHAFAVYALVCQAIGAVPTVVPAKRWGHDLEAILKAIKPETKVLFLANPNNPTGTWFTRDEWEAFIEKVPSNVVVVLDEAYAEYIKDERYPRGVDYLHQYPNLVVCKTFSKAYGLAALRVGYGLSSIEIADYLNRVRQPFNVNHMAIHAAVAALGDQRFVDESCNINVQGLEMLVSGFQALGLSFIPSVANFISVDVGQPAAPIYEALLREGVIVRPVHGYGMPHFLRVSVGRPDENRAFLQALKKVLRASA